MSKQVEVACIGAGPAGLTAAYLLSKSKIDVSVLEMDSNYVGGISRTVQYKGFYFDIGGHRFFSKSKEVEALWDEILPDDMIVRNRSSKICYRGKFFSYPLKAVEALLRLGIFESILCVLSYLKAQVFKKKHINSFEDWVSGQFGQRLYRIFFKTYTEKVWGISCKEISADWAAQRIKGLSLATSIYRAIIPQNIGLKNRSKIVKSLISTFRYPRKGPGMMWEAARAKTEAQGGEVMMGTMVTSLKYDAVDKKWHLNYKSRAGETGSLTANHIISSMPLRLLVENITPAVSAGCLQAAQGLSYRAFLTVALMVHDKDSAFDDNWIYIHEPDLKVGRIQNFKSWSPEMVPDKKYNCYGLEYFCFEDDEFWNMTDEELVALAKSEITKLGLVKLENIFDGVVVRQRKAYPVYDANYKACIDIIRTELDNKYPNLHLIGRNGMHRYNNQDHAMMTAMLTVKNIIQQKTAYNVWQVNEDAEYHEESEELKESTKSDMVETSLPNS